MMLLTPLVVLVSELGQPGSGELHIALARAAYTLAGGVLALLASFLLWPTWEPERVNRELGTAVRAHGRYASTEISAVLGEASADEVESARAAAGLASNALEASLQRAMLEPLPHRRRALEAALTIDAALRRIAGRVSALHLIPGAVQHDPGMWRPWRDWIDRATESLARGTTAMPDRPPLPERDADADTLSRIAAQIDLIANAEGRMGAATAP